MVKASSSPSPNLSFKRRKQEDEASAVAAKRQRTRVSFSCGECHRRKQKCDRQIPCSHCVARKVPELCKAYTPGKADQDMNARITRLEHIIQVALPQYWSPSSSTSSTISARSAVDRKRSPSTGDDEETRSVTEEHDPIGGTFHSGKWYGNSASGSVAPSSVLEQVRHAFPSNGRDPHPTTCVRDPKNFDLAQATSQQSLDGSSTDDLQQPIIDDSRFLAEECGFSPHKIAELIQELPPLSTTDALVDFYFSTINWTRYPICETEFRSSYVSVCSRVFDGGRNANSSDLRFLPLLFVVLAISARLVPERMVGDARARRITSLHCYWSSRRALLVAAAIQPDSLDVVLTRLLSARFLTFDRRITECWSQLGAAVRTAQALGLHRDGSTMGMEPSMAEYRRRVWSYLYHADRSYALVLGRPNSIQDDYTSTRPPSNINDTAQALQSDDYPPLSSPTAMTFVILRHRLAEIMGRIAHHFQRVRERSHYSEVIALDEELLKFASSLPPHFSLNPDKALDETLKYIQVHRYLLLTEIMFVRMNLNRPYLLRRLNSDRYARSRQACFESAIKDFEIRQAFHEGMPKEARQSLSNAYRDFQTAIISGIYSILEPNGRYAEAMHAILDGFLKDHEDMRGMNETTRREVKIIEFFRMKASPIESMESHRTTSQSSEQQAQLLLGLQQSATSGQKRATLSTPPMTFSTASHIAQSPTFARLHHGAEHVNSPTTSGSPGTVDDDTVAQSLLDHWCNTVSNAPVDASTGAMSWGGPGGADFSGWVQPPNINGTDLRLIPGLDGSDWNYWEALVNQIQRP
ncbi:hypothetical protein M378DRAFT_72501 [Amanita muscaria Koide BX008]|uniref:Zn(2)-C6 fungal-type domain-containing protein n=1 Tax=Amanita muscaria (strain Koide BX008) TaxID=946122 RepID=A0A0C2SX43_AMAMK|nr:hypothetical protein M378DRAFT_72501 [Amanita muscaria Koide BX008]